MEKTRQRKTSTILQTAIAPRRGPAKHTETEGDLAVTVFDNKGFVKEIKTPPDAFRRVHEVMHANHTGAFDYPTIEPLVKNIVEDCRLHSIYWPWKGRETPQVVIDSANTLLTEEHANLTKQLEEIKKVKDQRDAKLRAMFARFASNLRGSAIAEGIGPQAHVIPRMEMPKEHAELAEFAVKLIKEGKHHEAAVLIQATFFPEKQEDEENEKKRFKSYEGDYEEVEAKAIEHSIEEEMRKKDELKSIEEAMHKYEIDNAKRMPIIELVHDVPTTHMSSGFRSSTSGPRIYRPALRKPVLPQRIFWKRSPIAPGGAILFDSSGSMSVSNELLQDCCLRAPAATIGYYYGFDHGRGKLIVYARGGMRAREIHPIECRSNEVDGPALEWLMQQEGPRIFVTDREFCGGHDAAIALSRLILLEELEEVEVITSYSLFQKIYQRVEPN